MKLYKFEINHMTILLKNLTKDKGFLSKEYMQVAKNPPNTLTLKSVDIKSFSM